MTTPRAVRLLPIVVFALLPAVGILLLGWDWREVLIVYWLENVSLGVAMVIRLLRAARADAREGGSMVNGVTLTLFFCAHYGLFTIVHGVFVFVIASGAFSGLADRAGGDPRSGTPIAWTSLLIVWVIGAAAQVGWALFGPPPATRGRRLMMTAYPRIMVLHVAILGGVFLIVWLGLPAAAALLLVALHAIVDVVGFVVTSRRAPTAAGSPARAQ